MSKIEIKNDEAAIIFGPDGQINVLFPQMDGGAMVPPHLLLAMALGCRSISEETFCEECVEWLLRERVISQ